MTAKLVVLAGPRCGETLPISSTQSTTIGRDATSELIIRDQLMSRRHCAIEPHDHALALRDLGSSNGTYVNGIPIRERELAHGDRIRVGGSVLLFLSQLPRRQDAVPLADDRTQRVPRDAVDLDPTIVAHVLSGRVSLQPQDLIGDSAPMQRLSERICNASVSS